ncbi:MAG: hypothetical protein VXY93_20215, partial [Pseudomonadota bacterium]|nr:hypothetical protein [Pseudomonadota bacterium]
VSAASTLPAGIITQTNTGDILRLYDSSTQVFTVDDTGNVGIATNNPQDLLHIGGTSTDLRFTANQIKFNRASSFSYIDQYGAGDIAIRTTPSGSQENRLVILSGGNIGIGTDNPTTKFDVHGKSIITDTGGDVLTLRSTVDTSRTTIKFNTNGNDWELGARGSSGNPNNTFYLYDNSATVGLNYRI